MVHYHYLLFTNTLYNEYRNFTENIREIATESILRITTIYQNYGHTNQSTT
jgi:hypothetical protein